MGRALTAVAGLAAVTALMSGCGDENPTDVGAGLIPPAVTTFEVVLPAEEFLLGDTTFNELGELSQATFLMVANSLDGVLDAHTLLRIQRPDGEVTWTDTTGVTREDSIVSYQGARFTLVVDSVGPVGDPVTIEVRPLLESWHAPSTTWELRYDTAGVSAPWTEPGGTAGEVVGSGLWRAGADTVIIEVDSAGATVWQDSAGAFHGALFRSATPDSRLRIRSLAFEFLVVPDSRADTVVSAGSGFPARLIADPEPPPPAAGVLRVGGLPTWRSLLHFRDLDGVSVPYAVGLPEECQVPLSEATINLATLLLQPVPGGPFRLETLAWFEGRAVLEAPTVPLTRSPLSGPLGQTESLIGVERFTTAPDPAELVRLPLTLYVKRLLQAETDEERMQWLALTAEPEGSQFGYATFASTESAAAPRLRLLISVPTDELPCDGLD